MVSAFATRLNFSMDVCETQNHVLAAAPLVAAGEANVT